MRHFSARNYFSHEQSRFSRAHNFSNSQNYSYDNKCNLTSTFESDSNCLIMCKSQAVQFPAMIDSGSQRSLIKNPLFQKFKIKINPPKNGEPPFLYNASDGKMPVIGVATIDLNISGLHFIHNFIVMEELSLQCILGRDFMALSDCDLKYSNNTVTLCDDKCSVNMLKDFRVTTNLALLANDVKIDPHSECLVSIILKNITHTKEKQFLVEPLPALYQQKYYVGNALIQQSGKDKMFILVKNFFPKKLKIKKRTPLAQLLPFTKNFHTTPWTPPSPPPTPPAYCQPSNDSAPSSGNNYTQHLINPPSASFSYSPSPTESSSPHHSLSSSHLIVAPIPHHTSSQVYNHISANFNNANLDNNNCSPHNKKSSAATTFIPSLMSLNVHQTVVSNSKATILPLMSLHVDQRSSSCEQTGFSG